jgi:hypothetical protein
LLRFDAVEHAYYHYKAVVVAVEADYEDFVATEDGEAVFIKVTLSQEEWDRIFLKENA